MNGKSISNAHITPLLMASFFILAACASKVEIQVQRTPNWKTAGIQRIAIMPVENAGSRFQKETADYITTLVTTEIRKANYFTLVEPTEIQRMQSRGENIENYVDALLSGKVVVDSRESSQVRKVYDPATKEMVDTLMYDREVQLSYTYSLSLARDKSIIGIETRTGKNTDSQKSRGDLKSPSQLMQNIVSRSWMVSLSRNLIPYVVTERLSMMQEKSKDKILKERMKEANGSLKAKNYRTALNAYLDIYGEYNNFAAAYNAAILHEALGDIPSALDLLHRLETETGNPQARNMIVRLNRIQDEQALFESEYSQAYSQIDRVTAYAYGEIQKVLPANAKVWVRNNEKNELIMASSVTDGISSALIKNGITVVDRENAAIIEMEQNFQMSGSVSDDDFVSIANAAGANTLITISISGAGAARRLQIQVIDIERRTTLLRSDASERWSL